MVGGGGGGGKGKGANFKINTVSVKLPIFSNNYKTSEV